MRVGEPRRAVVISALGVTQILAWGTSYYLPAVLAKPIAADTGWPLSFVVGGLSLGLLAAGVVSPRVGRAIQARGGRPVLALSSILLGAGLALLALATHLPLFFAAWAVIVLGMGAGLYDAAFATLGRAYGAGARSAITTLTLWGGFASTVCWPLSAILVEQFGWRGTCGIYAVVQLAFSAPVHLLLMPRVPPHDAPPLSPNGAAPIAGGVLHGQARTRAFLLVATIITFGSIVAGVISVHLLTLLQARGFELAAAVGLGALVGPSQVGARIVEAAFHKRYHPLGTMMACTALLALGLGLLLVKLPFVAVALVIYGAGNGLTSIARGTVPLALFGSGGYAALMGRLALPSLIAQALSPSIAALVLERSGPDRLLGLLFAVAALNVGLVFALWSFAGRNAAA